MGSVPGEVLDDLPREEQAEQDARIELLEEASSLIAEIVEFAPLYYKGKIEGGFNASAKPWIRPGREVSLFEWQTRVSLGQGNSKFQQMWNQIVNPDGKGKKVDRYDVVVDKEGGLYLYQKSFIVKKRLSDQRAMTEPNGPLIKKRLTPDEAALVIDRNYDREYSSLEAHVESLFGVYERMKDDLVQRAIEDPVMIELIEDAINRASRKGSSP